jgi:hypothetical protein
MAWSLFHAIKAPFLCKWSLKQCLFFIEQAETPHQMISKNLKAAERYIMQGEELHHVMIVYTFLSDTDIQISSWCDSYFLAGESLKKYLSRQEKWISCPPFMSC